ncbi:hypothetical protein K443DRAFT_442839 [Laccaria amethystina LaAM-08-1]|uniref:Uncharacterized protein n=1 Tax=Laccaria amethystina LaAM-08-1 TaxID=1095629 RepID=A0A0C9WWJ4_9AGAR|nr:hypothetical protein K443DRAFT_442839 [Laccaria amethystina LaAM-08-1]
MFFITIQQFINIISPLLLRILVDKARRKVLGKTAFTAWNQYYATFPNQRLCQDDVERLTSLPADVAAFISSPTTKVRLDGNKAAHTAEKGDILDAVERTNFATRYLLEREDEEDEDEHHQDYEAEDV